MNRPPFLVDRADLRVASDGISLILGAAGVHVLLLRLRHDAPTEEVVDSAGLVAAGALSAWTLIGRDMSLELHPRAAAALGLPRDLRLNPHVDAATLRQIRAALPEIVESARFVVDTADDRTAG